MGDLDELLGIKEKTKALPKAQTRQGSNLLADLDELIGNKDKAMDTKVVPVESKPDPDLNFFKELFGEDFTIHTEVAPEIRQNAKSGIAGCLHTWNMTDPVPKSHDFLIGTGGDGMFPLGSVSVVASPGGMMKTATAVSLLLHCASGKDWAGLPVVESCGLLLALEDDKDETTRRLIATARAQIDSSKHETLASRIKVAALSGIDARLTSNVSAD